ncbi:MAG: hypothetical protein R2747_09460 [Pyrinomonadaceae bacterium]
MFLQIFSINEKEGDSARRKKLLFIILILATGVVYYLSNPEPQYYYDYTFRVAENFLRGRIGFTGRQPSWLNEMIPFEGQYYSAFPYGSVLSMMPFSILKYGGIVKKMPAAFIAGVLASLNCLFLFLISRFYRHAPSRRILLAMGIMFGTWFWTNLTMAGAWQLTLGFAMLGELGAIYFTVYDRKPILAGAFFALAFGNRTEIVLTAPIFLFLLWMPSLGKKRAEKEKKDPGSEIRNPKWPEILNRWGGFCLVPFLLGVSTLVYNYVRFHSPFDFGHSHIPGVLDEPWYRYGIFSIYYIPYNFTEMLLTGWKSVAGYPFYTPTGFGGSIIMASPFLLFALRFGARNKFLKYTAWVSIVVMTFLLWIHGNAGGWQFSYRYAIILLPWLYLILLENSPKKITVLEWITYIFSFIINLYATYLFLWTDYVKP